MDLVEKIIQPGIKIELRPDDQPKDAIPGAVLRYESKISDVKEDGTVEVYMPIEYGRLVLLSVGSKMDMFCYAGGIYECRVVVKERYKSEGLYYLGLQLISQLQKRQRREYYRYSCSIPVEVRRMDSAEKKWMTERGKLVVMEDLPMEKNTAVDISGGGMQFTGQYRYEAGEFLYGKFSFGKEYRQCMKVLESSEIPDRPGEYRHRVRFLGMERHAREEIIQNIFVLERVKRKFEYELE